MATKTTSQTRQSNGCRHVGGLCLIDESQKAGKCVQTCKKCGWIRVHGERFFHPAEDAVLNPGEAPMRRTVDPKTGKDRATKCKAVPQGEITERVVTEKDAWGHTRVVGGHVTVKVKS
jgi:hypothetical protein